MILNDRGIILKLNKVTLYFFILFLLILGFIVEGISFRNEAVILLFSSALAILISYIRSYRPALHKPVIIAGSFLVAVFAIIVLGQESTISHLLFLFPITVVTLGYGLYGGVLFYFLSVFVLFMDSRWHGTAQIEFMTESLVLGLSSIGLIFISVQLYQVIDKNEEWLEKLHIKINEMSLLREITTSMQTASDMGKLNKIVLTTLTAGYGLGFNRAVVFLVDGDEVTGQNAIGPSTRAEAYRIWGKVVTSQSNLHDVIEFHEDSDLKLLDTVKGVKLSLTEDLTNPIIKCCTDKSPMLVRGGNPEEFGEDLSKLSFENYALVPMIAKNLVVGVFLVDNRFNEKPITDADLDTLITFAGQSALAFENIRLYERIRKLAITDELTGLYNHRYYKETIHQLMKNRTPFSLMVIDVDNFKQFNENYGHATGDKVLSEVGKALKNAAGTKGLAFRYGGDEFTIIMQNTDREETLEAAKAIQSSISDIAFDVVSSCLTLSIGIAQYPKDAETEKDLFVTADKKLKNAKDSGKNTVAWEVV